MALAGTGGGADLVGVPPPLSDPGPYEQDAVGMVLLPLR